jgi:arsenate reductase (glutaredoxin)
MAEVTIYHNPNCSTSKHAVATAADLGADVEVVQYLKTPPDDATLRAIIAKLEDPVVDLVRRDANWQRLGLSDADVASADQVIGVLVAHPELMQRPLLVTTGRAIIGRPKDRVAAFLG